MAIGRNSGRFSGKRKSRGEALISVGAGALLLISLAFFGLDLISLVLVNSANDRLARNAARAAANQQDQASASQAAAQVVQDFQTSMIVPMVQLATFNYTADQQVTVITSMNVKIPCGLPWVPNYVTFQAKDTEAIVGVPATL
jgi:hypothetical protein